MNKVTRDEFAALVLENKTRMYRLALGILKNEADAEDADKLAVKYGHLDDILVEEGQVVSQGDDIATFGKTGMATGPNLYFAVYENGEAVNPIK